MSNATDDTPASKRVPEIVLPNETVTISHSQLDELLKMSQQNRQQSQGTDKKISVENVVSVEFDEPYATGMKLAAGFLTVGIIAGVVLFFLISILEGNF